MIVIKPFPFGESGPQFDLFFSKCMTSSLFFHPLRLSMEHHMRYGINAPPHNETWFTAIIKVRSLYSQCESFMSRLCKPSILTLSCPTTTNDSVLYTYVKLFVCFGSLAQCFRSINHKRCQLCLRCVNSKCQDTYLTERSTYQ